MSLLQFKLNVILVNLRMNIFIMILLRMPKLNSSFELIRCVKDYVCTPKYYKFDYFSLENPKIPNI